MIDNHFLRAVLDCLSNQEDRVLYICCQGYFNPYQLDLLAPGNKHA